MANQSNLVFTDYSAPGLSPGKYLFKASQTLKAEVYTSQITFQVQGLQFALTPDTVHGMFPAPGSTGQFSADLPHIALKKETLLWERSPFQGDDIEGYPWLVLLLFDESELQKELVSPIIQGKARELLPLKHPGVEDQIQVIDVQRNLLEQLMPSEEELRLLAHVRRRPEQKKARSLLMGARLPAKGRKSIIHIVSVEGCYKKGAGFDFNQEGPNDRIRLMSLKSWEFSCPIRYKITRQALGTFDKKADYAKLHEGLIQLEKSGKIFKGKDAFQEVLTTPLENVPQSERKKVRESLQQHFVYTRTFSQLAGYLSVGTLASDKATRDATVLEKKVTHLTRNGYVPLPHRLRQCDRTHSWYRGPCSSARVIQRLTDINATLPLHADQLTRYFKDLGMLDVTYSAAFQLGRSLALQDVSFVSQLFDWKKSNDLHLVGKQEEGVTHLLGLDQGIPQLESTFIKDWLVQKGRLTDIPFNYLVPHHSLLPEESIRFFQVDNCWIEALFCGAYTLGQSLNHSSLDSAEDQKRFMELTSGASSKTGFFIRSQLVAGWPDFFVDAFGESSTSPLPLLQKVQFGVATVMYVFEGTLQHIKLSLNPEGLHFGLDEPKTGKYKKQKTDVTLNDKRRVDMANLAQELEAQGAAQFGRKMMVGSGVVRFEVKTKAP